MEGRRIAFVLIVGLAALVTPVMAQPAPGEEIEMEPEPATEPATDPAADPAPQPAPEAPAEPAEPAEPPPVVKDPKLAKKLHYAGVQLVRKGDYYTRAKKPDEAKTQYEQAVTAFEKAIETGDDLHYYFDLANVEEKLGKLDLAAKHHRVLIKATEGVRPDIVKKATAKFDELSTKIGIVTLNVIPELTAISLSGNVIGKSPLPESLILMPGTYNFSFASDGYQPKESEIKVEEGSESERTIELEPIKIVVEAVKPREEEPVEVPVETGPNKLPLYIGGGATVGLFAIATVTGILAISQHGTYTSNDASGDERDSAKSSGKTLALVTDICLVGSLGAAAFTTYYYLYKYKRSPSKPADQRRPGFDPEATGSRRPDRSRSAKVDLLPWVQPESAGLVLGGSF